MEGKNDNKQGRKARKTSQAPEPISPLRTLGALGIFDTQKPEQATPDPKPKPPTVSELWTITNDELMRAWGVDSLIITQLMLYHGLPVWDSITLEIFNIGPYKDWLSHSIKEGPFDRFRFRPCDIEEFQQQHGSAIEELKKRNAPIIGNGQGRDVDKKKTVTADAYIQQKRNEGVKDEIIAFELHDETGNFKLSYLETARELGCDKDLHANQIDAIKQRGRRACEKGKALLQKQ